MLPLSIDTNGALCLVASDTSAAGDFDFLVGRWTIRNRKLKTRLDDCREWSEFEAHGECRKILNGLGNIDSFQTSFDGQTYEGAALRLFNPQTKLWSIYWANSEAVTLDVPQIGSFENGIGEFYSRDRWKGKDIVVLYRWEATDENTPKWSQAFSPDRGATWEWNWHMTFHRQN